MPGELILLVEDNDNNRLLIRDVLQASGYLVAEAETAEDGLRMAAEQHPALILMDIQLPVLDGHETTRQIKADPNFKVTPIIAVSSYAMKGDEERIREGGCEAYLSKPISVAKFIETVRQFLGAV